MARRAATLAVGGVGLLIAVGGAASASPGEIPGKGVLPDNRGYEKVSPSDKAGANALEFGLRAASPDGTKFHFQILSAAPDSLAGKDKSTLSATRDPLAGWATSAIDPPIPPSSGAFIVGGSVFMDFTADRSQAVLHSYSKLTADAVDRTGQLYVRDNTSGTYELITPRHPEPSQFATAPLPQIGGHSTDFTRVSYHTTVPQTDDPVATDQFQFHAYEWVKGQGVRLIGVLPDGSLPAMGSLVGAGGSTTSGSSERALSRDGSRAFFHVPVDFEVTSSSVGGQLYVRDDQGTLSTADDTTSHVSASQRSTPDPAGPMPAIYWTAEAERGSKVLFTSCEQLTEDSTANAAADSTGSCASGENGFGLLTPLQAGLPGRDLYLYDVDSGDLTDLTTTDPDGGDVLGVVGASEDLSHVYFVAGGELDPSTTAEQPGGRNLYLWNNGTIRFIATMDNAPGSGPTSMPDWINWAPDRALVQRSHRVTPDGEHLLFMSRAPLTGYDNTNPECGEQLAGSGVFSGLCAELYLYDAAGGKPSCVSCAQNGTAVTGDAVAMPFRNQPPRSSDPYARNLLEDGTRAFFQTPDALVTDDSNGKVDVYQWVRDGAGGCQNPVGCVSLISTGKSAADSFFADASEGGNDVFFTTYERLTGADTDDFVDMYDARVGGGFPEPPSPGVPCESSACQPGPSSPPLFGSPLSATPDGKGDVVPRRRATLSVSKLTKAQQAKLVNGGSVALRVRVNRGGKVSLAARARVGRRLRVVDSSSRRVKRAGAVRLAFGLSRAARAELARDGRLRMTLSVRFTGVSLPKELVLNLKPTPKGR